MHIFDKKWDEIAIITWIIPKIWEKLSIYDSYLWKEFIRESLIIDIKYLYSMDWDWKNTDIEIKIFETHIILDY